MGGTSARFGLPLLAAGQAQKEVTHNEALTLIEQVVQPVVREIGANAPPSVPAIGHAWVVGIAPTGAWAGHANALAGWTEGGWRFVEAMPGFAVWSIVDAAPARFVDGAWATFRPAPAIVAPNGGATVDSDVRRALGAILEALRAHRLIAR